MKKFERWMWWPVSYFIAVTLLCCGGAQLHASVWVAPTLSLLLLPLIAWRTFKTIDRMNKSDGGQDGTT